MKEDNFSIGEMLNVKSWINGLVALLASAVTINSYDSYGKGRRI